MSWRTNRRTQKPFQSRSESAQRGAATFQERESARYSDAQMRLNKNPNQAIWITMGRGFGRRTGWLTQNGFFPTGSFRGGRPEPGRGGVKVGDKMLDLSTGKLTPWKSGAVTYLGSYAQAEREGITPRDEIIGTIYDPSSDKVLAFWRGHTFSHVGRNMPLEGWGKFLVQNLETGDFIDEISANNTINAHDLAMKRYPQTVVDVVEVPSK